MTEVLISQNDVRNAAWFQTRPLIETEELDRIEIKSTIAKEKKSLWLKIKEKLFKKIKEGDKIIPVFSIKEVKSRAYLKVATTNGAIFSRFSIC